MTRFLIGAVLAAAVFGWSCQAFAQNVPSVTGLTPFSPQTKYMSLAGFLRWQYYMQNDQTWISIEEAQELVNSQMEGGE
jgi:hypothetical protein